MHLLFIREIQTRLNFNIKHIVKFGNVKCLQGKILYYRIFSLCLIVVVKFTIGYIFIRKVCTHKEYDKLDCSTI